QPQPAEQFQHLFSGRPTIDIGYNQYFSIGPKSRLNQDESTDMLPDLEVRLRWFYKKIDNGKPIAAPYQRQNGETQNGSSEYIGSNLQSEIFLGIKRNLLKNGQSIGESTQQSPPNMTYDVFTLSETYPKIPCFYVSTQDADLVNLGRTWDKIALTELEDDVITILRILNPDIERLYFVENPDPSWENPMARVPLVKLKGEKRPVSLYSMGDGLRRSITLALAITTVENGFLLIDEIENGLHYRIQTDLWRVFVELAERFNVQIFATSHSWDAIESLQEVVEEKEYKSCVLTRLQKRGDKLVPVVFGESELIYIIEDHIEVR
ncbi:MAG: AAA family ATPase, partial [Chloroflexota bacterium]